MKLSLVSCEDANLIETIVVSFVRVKLSFPYWRGQNSISAAPSVLPARHVDSRPGTGYCVRARYTLNVFECNVMKFEIA